MQYADVMHQFATRHSLEDLTDETLKHLYDGNFSIDKAHDFIRFYRRIEAELLTHPAIANNPYTTWFRQADLRDAQVRHFLVQFSVVINQLLIARAHRVVNAGTAEQVRDGQCLLLEMLGVPGEDSKAHPAGAPSIGDAGVSATPATSRFEGLVALAEQLGLSCGDLGHRDQGTPGTLFLCDELLRLYASTDITTAEAAAFAVDNWSTTVFWRDLVEGMTRYQASRCVSLPTAVFERLADDTPFYDKEKLENSYFTNNLDEQLYMTRGYEMLDGIYAFWKGLDDDRKHLH
ncbi:hypothetical protein FKG94_09570 [Exilibacterium tricleocarpae]|uniref:Iron-containing redox enzyme family protein n=1 Tax=Exilibacterium tricleocarpae TaxID=2591008 RepID=A0A545TVS8_9GAMM|nr:hypothetical protein [Exilibacterium tricleocarpae]TQV81329.1 hypothetical protein FKG94_09570 [Exilibacterium tricleocarpae]